MHIEGPNVSAQAECERVLRSVPQWFGIEPALMMYAADTTTKPTFLLRDGPRVIGFMTLAQHFPHAWEMHCVAVHAQARNQGHGSTLLAHAEAWLVAQGALLFQVKTVAARNRPPEPYAETRAFYDKRGFMPLEVFPLLWDAHNPCLQMIKLLPGCRVRARVFESRP